MCVVFEIRLRQKKRTGCNIRMMAHQEPLGVIRANDLASLIKSPLYRIAESRERRWPDSL